MGRRARVAQAPLRMGKRAGRRGRHSFPCLDFGRTGTLPLLSSPATPLPLPQTSPASLHSSAQLLPAPRHTCYLFSFSAIWAFCSASLISLKLQTPLTEVDHDNMPHSSFLFLPVFCQWSGLNWHWLVVGQVQKHRALPEHLLELSAHVKMSSLENLCDCTE